MSPRLRRPSLAAWARTLGGLLIAAVGLAVAFRRVDVAALGAALRQASWAWFAAACAATILAVVLRAWRWRLLLAPIETIGVGPLFSATMIGYFGNGVLPLRLGELMRAAAIGRRGGRLDASTALGSIAVERLLDVLGAAAVAALVLPLAGSTKGAARSTTAAVALVIAGIAGWWILSRNRRAQEWLTKLASRRPAGRLGALALSFLRGLLVLGESQKMGAILAQTVLIWLVYGVTTWMAGRAAGLSFSWLDTGLVMIATTVAVSVPAAPGYVGTYHAAAVLVVADLLGYQLGRAQAFALLVHATSWIPTVAIGALCLLMSSVRVGEIREMAASVVPKESAGEP